MDEWPIHGAELPEAEDRILYWGGRVAHERRLRRRRRLRRLALAFFCLAVAAGLGAIFMLPGVTYG